MDSQQQAAVNEDNNGGSGNNNSNRGSFICSSRQTSSRWTPTSEQIRILKELYYNTGLRSPNADQIQKISANLRQYGKIEGKNVFYWFQNHKARERQKKRFTTPAATATSDHLPMHRTNSFVPTNNKFSNNIAPGHGQGHGLSSASAGQMGNYGSYASAAMEKSFGDCSISASTVEQNNYGYVGIENYSPCYTNFFDKKRGVEKEQEYYYDQQQIEEEPRNGCQIRKTLELFPVHNIEDDMKTAGFCNFRPSNWFGSAADLDHGDGGSRASLELTLNSYASYSGSNDCL